MSFDTCGYADQSGPCDRREYPSELRENGKVYQTVIPVGVKAAETSAAGQSIYSYDKNSTVAKAYASFTREVVRDGERQRNKTAPSRSR